MDTNMQYVNAFNLLLKQVEQAVEKKIPDWLDKNPYWEIDDDDGRPAYYPATTEADAREAICETILNQADDMGFYDFFEFVVSKVCDYPLGKQNPYRSI